MINRCIPYKYKKWFTLLGGVLIHLSLGSIYTFGNFSPYLTSYLREYTGSNARYAQTVWILTVLGLGMCASTVVGGILNVKFKIRFKILIFIGCLMASLGCGLTYFTIKMSYMMTLLTYGLLAGLGTGMGYFSPMSIAMKWFPHSKGFANSCILFGFGASAFIFDQVQTLYINPDNYSPDKPYSPEFPDEKYFSKLHADLLERVPKCCLIMFACFVSLQIVGLSLMSEYEPEDQSGEPNEKTNLVVNEDVDEIETGIGDSDAKDTDEVNSLGVKYKSHHEGMTGREAMKTFVFWVVVVIMNFAGMAPGNVMTYYKAFGQTFIEDDKFLAVVGSVSSIFNSTGRLFWGFLCDKLPAKVCLLIVQTLIIAFVATFYLTKVMAIKELYFLWICMISFSMCGIFATMPTTVAKMFGQRHFSTIMGLIMITNIASSFLGSFLGEYKDSFGWFWFYAIGCFLSLISWTATFFFNVQDHTGRDI